MYTRFDSFSFTRSLDLVKSHNIQVNAWQRLRPIGIIGYRYINTQLHDFHRNVYLRESCKRLQDRQLWDIVQRIPSSLRLNDFRTTRIMSPTNASFVCSRIISPSWKPWDTYRSHSYRLKFRELKFQFTDFSSFSESPNVLRIISIVYNRSASAYLQNYIEILLYSFGLVTFMVT